MLQSLFTNTISHYSENKELCTKYWQEIASHYSSKSRHYHNLTHLEKMFSELEFVKPYIQDLDTIRFSIFYHDIIYNASSNDNEHQSALFLKKCLSNTTFSNISECIQQIEATQKHQLSKDSDTNYLLDIDLTILGQDSDTYQEYCKNIRREYRIYPDFIYKKGRKKVLQQLLSLTDIYKTEFFKKRYEKQAIANLEIELSTYR